MPIIWEEDIEEEEEEEEEDLYDISYSSFIHSTLCEYTQ